MITPRTSRRSGMTLTELLVVIAIILLLSAATLPTAYVAFAERAVSEAASIVQANLSMTRDRATGTGRPQGVRFLPDPDISGGGLASNRMVTLTTPPNYSEGWAIPIVEIFTPEYTQLPFEIRRLAFYGAKTDNEGLPSPPTAWHFNIRQGERLRIAEGGNEFIVAGPISQGPTQGNFDRYINRTKDLRNPAPPINAPQVQASPNPINSTYEILYVVNGRDDLGDGYIDPQFNGINSNGGLYPDGSPLIDPGFNGRDDNGNNRIDDPAEMLFEGIGGVGVQYEPDVPTSIFKFARVNFDAGPLSSDLPPDVTEGIPLIVPLESYLTAQPEPISANFYPPGNPNGERITRHRYTISRRPMPARDSREYTLPGGAVVDFTTSVLGSASERSRVPIDPATGYVDLIFFPNGQVIPSTPYGLGRSLDPDYPFFFLWIAAREDVHPPVFRPPSSPINPIWPVLPLPADPGFSTTPILQGYRRMVTISPRSGQTSVSEISLFGRVSDLPNDQARALFREIPYEEARDLQQTGR